MPAKQNPPPGLRQPELLAPAMGGTDIQPCTEAAKSPIRPQTGQKQRGEEPQGLGQSLQAGNGVRRKKALAAAAAGRTRPAPVADHALTAQLQERTVIMVAIGFPVKNQSSDLAAMRAASEFQLLVNPFKLLIVAVEDSDCVLC